MDSIVFWFQGLTYLQIAFLAGGVSGLWWIFDKYPNKFLAACLFFVAVMVGICAFPPQGDITPFRFLLLVGAFYAAYAFWHNFANYEEIQVESIDDDINLIDHKRQLQVAQNNLQEQRERTRHLPWEIDKKIKLDQTKLVSELLAAATGQEVLEIDREEQGLRRGLIEVSKKTGLPPEVITEVLREIALGRVKTQQKSDETRAVIQAGELLKTGNVQTIKQLNRELIEALREKQAIIDGKDAQAVKDDATAAYDAIIDYLKRQINEQQGNGLASSGNGSKAHRPGEKAPDVRGHTEPSDERPQEPVSSKRGRGRPRKDSPQ